VESMRLRLGQLRGAWIGALALIAVLALAVGAGEAKAASPVLEFESSSSPLPIPFTATGGPVTAVLSDFATEVHCAGSSGQGAITGPRSALSSYVFTGCEAEGAHCQSENANQDEIQTPLIEAELVFINQAQHEVGMLLAPQGNVYMSFKCGGEAVEAIGPFLSPVGPINQESSIFSASLYRFGALQIPNGYEGPDGELLQAIPTAEREGNPGTTGVELGFTITTGVPLTVKAITAAEVEAKQRDEEAAAKKRHDDEEAAKAAAAKKKQEEEAADKKRQEEETAATKREEERSKAQGRARQLSKALKRCRRAGSKQKRVRCETRTKKRLGAQKASKT
jgi:hypothetical protein